MSALLGLRFVELKFKSRPPVPLLTDDDQLNPLLPTFVSAPVTAFRLPVCCKASSRCLVPPPGASGAEGRGVPEGKDN